MSMLTAPAAMAAPATASHGQAAGVEHSVRVPPEWPGGPFALPPQWKWMPPIEAEGQPSCEQRPDGKVVCHAYLQVPEGRFTAYGLGLEPFVGGIEALKGWAVTYDDGRFVQLEGPGTDLVSAQPYRSSGRPTVTAFRVDLSLSSATLARIAGPPPPAGEPLEAVRDPNGYQVGTDGDGEADEWRAPSGEWREPSGDGGEPEAERWTPTEQVVLDGRIWFIREIVATDSTPHGVLVTARIEDAETGFQDTRTFDASSLQPRP
ncbi:MAG: hypothetical protein J7480_05865 [Microbacteriaceae bacterium]|nr:hypothetical protein [Microbacteriaceae bacterium]